MLECRTCPKGHVALPGYFLESFTEDRVAGDIVQSCSGKHCPVIVLNIISFY